jgi:2-polyprenyl-6-methoxyphenol hydroxylase-like FAD-dependent oxidoreductase
MDNKLNKPEVLIVGAGPTGLMMACQLALNGVTFRIIEKNSGPTTQSRALAIHARSMEIFSQMGLAEKFIAQGKKARAINYVVNGKVKQQIRLEEFGKEMTEFPFILILDQSKTEQLLLDFLNGFEIQVEWNTELTTFEQTNDRVRSILAYNNKQESLETSYLIGADGAKSKVREVLNIPFEGKTYQQSLFVLDCKVDANLKDDEGYIAFSKYSLAAIFRLPDGRCRIISLVPPEFNRKDTITFDDVEKTFASRMQMDIKLSDPKWISIYRSHHRCTANFRKGRCFLVGDSAHVHSPVGGQGMNTGLQDAYNLAWKLAFVIQGKAKPALLETYEEERLPTAKDLVKSIDRVFSLVTSENIFFRFIRMHISPKVLTLLRINPLARFAFRKLSQIGIRYEHSSLTQMASLGKFPSKAPKPGERFPFLLFMDASGKESTIQSMVNGISFQLILFLVNEGDKRFDSIDNIAHSFAGAVSVTLIQLNERTIEVYKALGMQNGGYYLIRPDMHVAYRSTVIDKVHLNNYLQDIFIPAVY